MDKIYHRTQNPRPPKKCYPRDRIDWVVVQASVVSAKDVIMPEKVYVNATLIAEHIIANKVEYPGFSDMPEVCLVSYRVALALDKLGWKRYTTIGSRRAIFIDPRVEQRHLVELKEAHKCQVH